MSKLKRIGTKVAEKVLSRVSGGTLPSWFVQKAPTPANMIPLFEGTWASKLPIEGAVSGGSDLFSDERIRWYLDRFGDAQGRTFLELGPLEGGHTHMLLQAGASKVTAVEANGLAWLKCLAVKETFGMTGAEFLLGDFMRYLEGNPGSWDGAVACGILYHLRDPHQLFPLLRRACKGRVMLWTMIWSDAIAIDHPGLHKRFSAERKATLSDGREIVLHRHEYRQTILSKGFFGGNESYSEWLSREDLTAAVEAAGYRIVETAFDEPRHPNGPALAMVLEPV